MTVWACDCHGRPFIHAALVLPFSQGQMTRAYGEAEVMARTYVANPRVRSDFKPDPKWTHRGPLAEIVLAEHLGVSRTSARDARAERGWDHPDLEPDIKIRATKHHAKPERQAEMCLALLEKDRRKVPKRRWVLATVRYATSEVLYWGYRHGRSIALAPPGTHVTWTTAYDSKERLAIVYPDELADIADLVASVAV